MIDDCITKLQELDRHCRQVNEMTPAMHEEFEKALIELLHHASIDNHRAMMGIRKLQQELELTRWGLKAALTELCKETDRKILDVKNTNIGKILDNSSRSGNPAE